MMLHKTPKYMQGFTLLEAVMVMVITGILGALVASFVTPLKGYFDATARADLSDVADTALRRMGRELSLALPNSVRVSGSYIEFLPTVTGGRYRSDAALSGVAQCGGTRIQDILDFTGDTCFEVIGGLYTTSPAPTVGQELVIYNTTPAHVYNGSNVAAIATGSTPNKIMFSSKQFPLDSPGKRFQIISAPVTFTCVGNILWRYSGYTRQATQPTNFASTPLSSAPNIAKIATSVNCTDSSFVYNSGVNQRNSMVTINLTLSNSIDSITLLHEVHIQNAP